MIPLTRRLRPLRPSVTSLHLLPTLVALLGLATTLGACAPADTSSAADFRLPTLTGETIGPADFRGEVVVVDFWATWCVPCRHQAEILDIAHERWADKGVRFLAVDVAEPAETVREFVRENPFPYPVLLDEDDSVSARVGLQALPTVMVIDREGEVVYNEPGVTTGETLEGVLGEVVG